jgi:hypothetical protein
MLLGAEEIFGQAVRGGGGPPSLAVMLTEKKSV